MRASAIRQEFENKFDSRIKTVEIIEFCRQSGLTPILVDSADSVSSEPESKSDGKARGSPHVNNGSYFSNPKQAASSLAAPNQSKKRAFSEEKTRESIATDVLLQSKKLAADAKPLPDPGLPRIAPAPAPIDHSVFICLYCGKPHAPASDFGNLQLQCGSKLSFRDINTCTVASVQNLAAADITNNNSRKEPVETPILNEEPQANVIHAYQESIRDEINCVKLLSKQVGASLGESKESAASLDEKLAEISLSRVMSSFLSNFVKSIINVYKHEQSQDQCSKGQEIIVPYHVFKVAATSSSFDFLTNKNLGEVPPEGTAQRPTLDGKMEDEEMQEAKLATLKRKNQQQNHPSSRKDIGGGAGSL